MVCPGGICIGVDGSARLEDADRGGKGAESWSGGELAEFFGALGGHALGAYGEFDRNGGVPRADFGL